MPGDAHPSGHETDRPWHFRFSNVCKELTYRNFDN